MAGTPSLGLWTNPRIAGTISHTPPFYMLHGASINSFISFLESSHSYAMLSTHKRQSCRIQPCQTLTALHLIPPGLPEPMVTRCDKGTGKTKAVLFLRYEKPYVQFTLPKKANQIPRVQHLPAKLQKHLHDAWATETSDKPTVLRPSNGRYFARNHSTGVATKCFAFRCFQTFLRIHDNSVWCF